jgi:hypothetical protein
MTDSFWEPYRASTQRYMPAITSVRWVRRFQVGTYRAILGTDCDGDGSICYIHVIYVYRENDDKPYLAVSSEYACEQGPVDSPCLCLFFGGKHFNMGTSPKYVDLEIFTQKALEIIIDPLGSSETPKELPLN